jgi:hypothetical protein
LVNLVAPKNKKIKPTDLIELDCDNRNFVKQKVMTQEELNEVLNKYNNVKPTSNGK